MLMRPSSCTKLFALFCSLAWLNFSTFKYNLISTHSMLIVLNRVMAEYSRGKNSSTMATIVITMAMLNATCFLEYLFLPAEIMSMLFVSLLVLSNTFVTKL